MIATDSHLPASFLADDGFRRKARQILSAHSIVPAGCVHLLGLEEIRARVGRKWQIIEQRVHDVVERILRKNLATADAWVRYGGETYMIVFASQDKSKAQLTCGLIKTELVELLLGTQETRGIIVQTVIVDVNGQMLLESLPLANLLDAMAEQAADGTALSPDGNGTGSEPGRPSGTPGAAVSELPPGRAGFVHHPIWDAVAHVTSTYACLPHLTRSGAVPLTGYAVLEDREDVNAILELDRTTLLEGVATLTELFQNRFRYILVLPVHFETMANTKRRRDYLATCREISKYLSPFISFDLAGLPRGIPVGRLNEIATTLLTVGRTVSVRIGENSTDLATYAQCGIKAAGIELNPYLEGGKVTTDLEHFSTACQRVGLSAYADGIREKRTMDLAVKSGFKFLSGPFIGPDDSYPQHMARCSEKDLLMRARLKQPSGPQ